MYLQICGDDILCLFDVAATGDLTIGNVTKDVGKELETITQLLKPSMITLTYVVFILIWYTDICNLTSVYEACVSNNTYSCCTGYTGDIS